MSLIDDALKRAQAAQEAAREQGERPWTPPPLPDANRSVRARARRIFVVAGVAVLIGLGALLLWPARSAKPPASRSSASPIPAPTSALPVISSEVSVPPPPRGIVSDRSAPDARAPVTPRPNVLQGSHEAATASAPATPVLSARARAAEPRSYTGELPLPGGAKITLDGIVFSDTTPVAVLNGRVVSPGAFIEGYTVSQIQPDRVELERDGTRILLKLR